MLLSQPDRQYVLYARRCRQAAKRIPHELPQGELIFGVMAALARFDDQFTGLRQAFSGLRAL
jgi:hypothetical protein